MKYRKILSVILVVILSLLPIISLKAAADDKTVLLESYFESDSFENWVAFGNNCKLSISSTCSHSGKTSLLTEERSAIWSGPSVNILKYITSHETFHISAYVLNAEKTTNNISMSLKYTDVNSEENYITICKQDVGGDTWVLFEGEFEIPEDISDAILYFESSELETSFYIDDFQMYKYGGVPQDTETAIETPAAEYYFDFENSPENWIPRGGASIEVSDQFGYIGKCSLYTTNRKNFWEGPTVRLDHVQPGKNYIYSAYVMYNGKEYEENHIFLIELQYNYNGEEVYSVVSSKNLQKGTWSNIKGSFTVPEGASNIYLYIQTDNVEENVMPDQNDLMSFYVDNVSVLDSAIVNRRKMIKTVTLIVAIVVILLVAAFITALIIKKFKVTKAAVRSASLDAMTNTYNRNAFEKYTAELESSPKKCRKLYVTACDVNFLKYINDNYGHEYGDKAIKRCASILLKSVGRKGKVFRMGGDEFICFSEIDPSQNIKTEISIENANYDGYPFSMAFGTAKYDSNTDSEKPDIKVLIARSDKAMYKNKQEIKKQFKDFSGM